MGGDTEQQQHTTQNQTTTNAPPSWTAPYLGPLAQRTMEAMNQVPTQHYSGDQVASMSPEQLAAIQGAWGNTAVNADALAGWMQGNLGQLNGNMNFTTQLPNTSYSLAPRQELDNVINASINPVMRQLQENILPSLTTSALDAGAYSGDRAMRVMPTDAIRNATESMQNIAAQLGYEDYQNYENRRLQAYGMQTQAGQQNYQLETARQQAEVAARLEALGMQPAYIQSILQTQAGSGDLLRMAAELEQQQRQNQINNAVGMDQYASTMPFAGLDAASSIMARLAGSYGTQKMNGVTDTTTTVSQDPMGQILQAGLGLGMAAMGMPGGLGGMFGGATSALGGGATGASVFAGLSDERAKENLEHVDTLHDGLKVYDFSYIGDSARYRGVLAQDVKQLRPWAYIENFLGDLAGVDYGLLGA